VQLLTHSNTTTTTALATDWRNATPEMVADAAQHGIDLTDPAVIDMMLEMERERDNNTNTNTNTSGSSDSHTASAVQQVMLHSYYGVWVHVFAWFSDVVQSCV
jgi:hypothetical protein